MKIAAILLTLPLFSACGDYKKKEVNSTVDLIGDGQSVRFLPKEQLIISPELNEEIKKELADELCVAGKNSYSRKARTTYSESDYILYSCLFDIDHVGTVDLDKPLPRFTIKDQNLMNRGRVVGQVSSTEHGMMLNHLCDKAEYSCNLLKIPSEQGGGYHITYDNDIVGPQIISATLAKSTVTPGQSNTITVRFEDDYSQLSYIIVSFYNEHDNSISFFIYPPTSLKSGEVTHEFTIPEGLTGQFRATSLQAYDQLGNFTSLHEVWDQQGKYMDSDLVMPTFLVQ